MAKYRFFPLLGLAAAALVSFVVAGGVFAQDRRDDLGYGAGGRAAKAAAPAVPLTTGRIVRVDEGRRTLVLRDITGSAGSGFPGAGGEGPGYERNKTSPGARPTTGDGTAPGYDRDKRRPAAGRSGRLEKDESARGELAREGKMMTFTIAEEVRVTLDGKAATVADLRPDLYARVYVRRPDAGRTARDRGRPTAASDRLAAAERGRVLIDPVADRIEAFTRAIDARPRVPERPATGGPGTSDRPARPGG